MLRTIKLSKSCKFVSSIKEKLVLYEKSFESLHCILKQEERCENVDNRTGMEVGVYIYIYIYI